MFDISVAQLVCVWLSTIVDLSFSIGSILAMAMTPEKDRVGSGRAGVIIGSILAMVMTLEKERVGSGREGVGGEGMVASVALTADVHDSKDAVLMLLHSKAETDGQKAW